MCERVAYVAPHARTHWLKFVDGLETLARNTICFH